jgi:hypothetical protein
VLQKNPEICLQNNISHVVFLVKEYSKKRKIGKYVLAAILESTVILQNI